jgi:hypothetical protein
MSAINDEVLILNGDKIRVEHFNGPLEKVKKRERNKNENGFQKCVPWLGPIFGQQWTPRSYQSKNDLRLLSKDIVAQHWTHISPRMA